MCIQGKIWQVGNHRGRMMARISTIRAREDRYRLVLILIGELIAKPGKQSEQVRVIAVIC